MSVSMSVSCPSSSFDACKLKEQTRSVFICACPEIAGWKRPKEGATDRAPAKSPLVDGQGGFSSLRQICGSQNGEPQKWMVKLWLPSLR